MSEASELYMDRGLELYDEGKFVEAIAEWREALVFDSKDACLYNNIGIALSKLGQQEAAIADWREAIRLRPDFKSPHRSLAYALSATGYSSKALAAVRAAARLYPDDSGLYVWLGYHLMVEAGRVGKSGDKDGYEAAAAAFQQSIDLDPSVFDAHRNLGKIQWWLGKKREAIETLKAAVAADPNDAEAHIALFKCQSHAHHIHDMVRTVTAINNLPESEALNQHFEHINRTWSRIKIAFFTATGLAALLIWLRWKKQK